MNEKQTCEHINNDSRMWICISIETLTGEKKVKIKERCKKCGFVQTRTTDINYFNGYKMRHENHIHRR